MTINRFSYVCFLITFILNAVASICGFSGNERIAILIVHLGALIFTFGAFVLFILPLVQAQRQRRAMAYWNSASQSVDVEE